MLILVLISGCGQHIIGVEAVAWDAVITDTLDGALVVDARETEAFEAGHVPGSTHVHWTELTGFDEDGLWDVQDPEDLAALFGSRGIAEDEPVVLIGGGIAGWGDDGNLYWALRYLGHQDVRVYNGGYSGWLAAGGEASTAPPELPEATYVPELRPELLASTEEAASWEGVLLDVRSEEEWEAGHIPGATWMEWSDVFQDDAALLPEEELRALVAEVGITEDSEVLTYCQAGIRAGHTFMVLDALGLPRVANYVGSWARWTAEDGEVVTD